ncbi:hypothetical protein AB1484_18255 [Parafrankia sp. FMc6]|uniref:hypothetical protein n=1 Tax=Parafrankia soli TaxID=2599596 RepID=UPI0034D5683D
MTTEGIFRRAEDALLALVDDRAPEYSDGVVAAVENLRACLAPAAPQEDLYRTFLDANRHRSARYGEGVDAVHQWLNGLLREMRAPAAA